MSRISFYCVDRKKNFRASIPKFFDEIVLFKVPMELVSVQIYKEEDDERKYIVTLYTDKLFINIDRDIFINNLDKIPENIKVVNENTVMMNLHSIKFIKGTLRLQQQDDKINTILRYSAGNEQPDSNSYENKVIDNIITWPYYNCSKLLTECENNYNQEKKRNNNGDCNDCYRRKEQEYNSGLIICEENRRSCCDGEQTCINEKSELYQLNEQKDQEVQKIKNLQSTQNTLVIIICLLIIAVLLGLGIYLYFKK